MPDRPAVVDRRHTDPRYLAAHAAAAAAMTRHILGVAWGSASPPAPGHLVPRARTAP